MENHINGLLEIMKNSGLIHGMITQVTTNFTLMELYTIQEIILNKETITTTITILFMKLDYTTLL
ncbi:MAG: hypothetical protein K9W46_13850 [Candidatus Heimdallarchaeum endolithica]|uniref:Uncharacterized protein n=1 Tax=Candidatus Heimdallarchaeum endolithica TaxID=2876572 RepID=A0A9Y1FNZ3_9ARCH|nr:MAG: hypothetical protein K9W46_13850 [Candidatus Heimdallarchaeum endolithica]